MEPPSGPVATSKAKTRLRTGCNTCKTRKVKCDESRPECDRCKTTGRTCDGYTAPPPIQRRRQPKYAAAPQSLSLYQPVQNFSEASQDRRCFAYFRCRVVPDLSGCFEIDFWDRLVPQTAHAEPAVHHALLALGSLYESYSPEYRADPASLPAKLAVKHYTTAINLLSTGVASSTLSPHAILVSCLIFVWVEFVRDNLDAGLTHIQAGFRILKDLQNGISAQRIEEPVSRVFTRLQWQARQHGSPTSNFNSDVLQEEPPVLNDFPSTFNSLNHARTCLDLISNSLFNFTRRLHHPHLAPYEVLERAVESKRYSLEATRLSLLRNLEDWKSAFDEFRSAGIPVAGHDTKPDVGVLLLQLHHLIGYKTAQTTFWVSEMAYDELVGDYRQVICLAEEILRKAGSPWTGSSVIYFDIGVIVPLFFVTLKCRQPHIRRQAISLLKQAPEREGMWLRETCVQFAEMKMATEEDGYEDLLQIGGTLPECCRINHEQARESIVEGKKLTVLSYKQGNVHIEKIVEISAAMGEVT
ncbi:hypothetical protein MMC25_002702 [Agyrium rufum]|nr:hypothetical protein [Agyrium rufum]